MTTMRQIKEKIDVGIENLKTDYDNLPRGTKAIVKKIKDKYPVSTWERRLFIVYNGFNNISKPKLAEIFNYSEEDINFSFRRRRNELKDVLTKEDLNKLRNCMEKDRKFLHKFVNVIGCYYQNIYDQFDNMCSDNHDNNLDDYFSILEI